MASRSPSTMATGARASMARARPIDTIRLKLRLYTAGYSPNSLRAAASARAICEQHFPEAYDLEIVDMLKHPQRALADNIIVTPTLLKLMPLPAQRIVGGLNDTEQLLRLLADR